jgi:hypothetical protein
LIKDFILFEFILNKKKGKKSNIYAAAFILFGNNNCYAQLKVYSNNKAQIDPL